MLIAALTLLMQDLFERPKPEAKRATFERGRDRIDLRLSPTLDFPRNAAESPALGFEAQFNRNVSCNAFDVGAGFKTLFDQHVREEFLDGALSALQGEIASNALTLACEVSPTLCDLIKHYRLSSNLMLQMQYQQCQTLEEVVQGTHRKLAAEQWARCLDEQARAGRTLPDAMAFCKKSDLLADLSGRPVQEVDLLKEVSDLAGLGDGARQLLARIGQPLEVNGQSLRTRVQLQGLEPLFVEKRKSFETAWREAVDEINQGRLRDETLRRLVPEGSSPVTATEAAWIGLLPEERRTPVISSLATAAALAQLAGELRSIERALETADHLPTSDPWKREMDQRRQWIRNELTRLEEAYRYQSMLNASLAEAHRAAAADVARMTREKAAPVMNRRLEERAQSTLKPWGEASCPKSK